MHHRGWLSNLVFPVCFFKPTLSLGLCSKERAQILSLMEVEVGESSWAQDSVLTKATKGACV